MSDPSVLSPPATNTHPRGGGLDESVSELLTLLGTGAATHGTAPTATAPTETQYDTELQLVLPKFAEARKHTKVSPTATSALEIMEEAINEAATASGKKDYEAAKSALEKALMGAENVAQERERVRKAFTDKQNTVTGRLDEISKGAAKLQNQPSTLTDAEQTAKTAQALAKSTGEATAEDWPKANLELNKFDATIREFEKVLKEVGAYEEARAKLSRMEDSVKKINATKGRLKTLVDACVQETGKVKAFVDREDFVGAKGALQPLEKALKEAYAARREIVEKATKKKIKTAQSTQKGLLGKKIYEDIGSKGWVKMVDKILAVQLDEDFQQNYDKICEQVADDIASDPIVKDAKANWSTWMLNLAANKDKVETFMNQVVKLQSKRLGSDPPPVKWVSEPDPNDIGSFDVDDLDISLNQNSPANQDFEELLDTLTHENTHAYQTHLIQRLDGPVRLLDGTTAPQLKPGDPDYCAALVLKLNDFPAGYIRPNDSAQHPNVSATFSPYMIQACEKHAFKAGAKTGRAAYAKL